LLQRWVAARTAAEADAAAIDLTSAIGHDHRGTLNESAAMPPMR